MHGCVRLVCLEWFAVRQEPNVLRPLPQEPEGWYHQEYGEYAHADEHGTPAVAKHDELSQRHHECVGDRECDAVNAHCSTTIAAKPVGDSRVGDDAAERSLRDATTEGVAGVVLPEVLQHCQTQETCRHNHRSNGK